MLVEVRAIEKTKWHGKTGKDNFARPHAIECLYDKETGKYATGLSEKDIEYLRKEGVTYDLSDNYTGEPHSFWNSPEMRIKLPTETKIFDTTKPVDFIKVKVLKASRFVANSLREYEEGLFPDATHVIFDEAEEKQLKAGKVQKKRKANIIASKLSIDEKLSIIMILSNRSLRGNSQDFLDVEIDTIIEEDVDKFIKIAEMDESERYTRAAILEGLYKGILTKEGNVILYMGDRIGHNLDEAVNYFMHPDNQLIKAAILEKLST